MVGTFFRRQRTPRQGGEERTKVAGRRPQGRGTGGDTTRGQETIKRPGRERTRGRGTEGEGATTGTRVHTHIGHATTDGPAPPHPQLTPRDPRGGKPAKTLRRSTDLTPHEQHRLTPIDYTDSAQGKEGTPTRGEGATPPEGAAENTAAQPTTTPSPPGDDPAAARATTQATAQAPEEEEDTAATPRTRGKDPQRTRDRGTGPQGGQRGGHPPDPTNPNGTPGPPQHGSNEPHHT